MIPSGNCAAEPEMYKMAPEGISIHFARIPHPKEDPQLILKIIDNVPRLAQLLSHAEVDAIAFGSVMCSLWKGLGYDKEIIKTIEDATNIPATTASTAAVDALKQLGIKRVSTATPYRTTSNEKLRAFLEGQGFFVSTIEGRGDDSYKTGTWVSNLESDWVYDLAKKVNTPDSDGIFISCTALRAVNLIQLLESELDKPVVTANQAMLWSLLRIVGFKGSITGYGQLLQKT